MTAARISRRAFLGAGAALCLTPRVAFAQASGGMGLTSTGRVAVTSGFTAPVRAGLSSLATGIARVAPTRAQATEMFNAIAGRLWSEGSPLTSLAMAGKSLVGGAYNLFVDGDILDPLVDLSVGGSAIEVRFPTTCDGLLTQDKVLPPLTDPEPFTGLYNGSFSYNNPPVCWPRLRIKMYDPVSSVLPQGMVDDGWLREKFIQRPTQGGKPGGFDIWASRPISSTPVRLPPNTRVADVLSASQKLRLISNSVLNAIGLGMFAEARSVWNAGGFTGGGGSFGGGGAAGSWGDEVADGVMGNKPVKGGHTGSTPAPAPPTLGEADTPIPPQSGTPPTWQFPSDPIFPDDPGYVGTDPGTGGGTDPTNPGTGGGGTDPTNPGTGGGSSGPDCYPGDVRCPAKVDWGEAPQVEPEQSINPATPMEWFPNPFTPPQLSGQCESFSANFGFMGAVNIDPCPPLDQLLPIVRPIVVIGGTIEAGRTLLDL